MQDRLRVLVRNGFLVIFTSLSGCTQISLIVPTTASTCDNVSVSDVRAVNKDGLIFNDPVMGLTTWEFTPAVAAAAQGNICWAMANESLPQRVHFSITDLQCSGQNGMVEGYLTIGSDNNEERIRATAVTDSTALHMTTVCGSAIGSALNTLGSMVAESVSRKQ